MRLPSRTRKPSESCTYCYANRVVVGAKRKSITVFDSLNLGSDRGVFGSCTCADGGCCYDPTCLYYSRKEQDPRGESETPKEAENEKKNVLK